MELEELKPSLRRRQKRRDKRLDEEVIECYRRGWRTKHRKGYLKHGRAVVPDVGTREGMKRRHGHGTRSVNDNLEPLIRYLRSSVGHHWDKVYSELSRSLDRKTVTGQHMFDHLKHFVHTNVVKDGQRVISHDSAPWDISKNTWHRDLFYVHPKSGVLKEVKKKRKPRGKNVRG